MWQVDPVAQRRRHRRVGAAVIALLVAAVVTAGMLRLDRGRPSLERGFDALADAFDGPHSGRAAAIETAAAAFHRSVGVLALEPLALIGLALVGDMRRLDTLAEAPSPPETRGPEEVAAHTVALVAQGRVGAALRWLREGTRSLGARPSLRQLQIFVERLQSARQRRSAAAQADNPIGNQ